MKLASSRVCLCLEIQPQLWQYATNSLSDGGVDGEIGTVARHCRGLLVGTRSLMTGTRGGAGTRRARTRATAR